MPSENEVDGEEFLLLTEEDFCVMVKPLDTRRKLIKIQGLLNLKPIMMRLITAKRQGILTVTYTYNYL